jgi:hypothetical protein
MVRHCNHVYPKTTTHHTQVLCLLKANTCQLAPRIVTPFALLYKRTEYIEKILGAGGTHPNGLLHKLLWQLPNQHRARLDVNAFMLKAHENRPLRVVPTQSTCSNAWGFFQNLPHACIHFSAVLSDLLDLQSTTPSHRGQHSVSQATEATEAPSEPCVKQI